MLNRKINVTDENNEILWQKKGEFANANYKGFGELIRQIEYKNCQNNMKINSVQLLGYTSGDTSIYLDINKDHYKEVTQALINHGFPKIEFINKIISTYKLNLSNIECLSNFLKALETIDPSIKAISKEMIDTFAPYSKEQASIPGWFKTHAFDYQFNSSGTLNRQVTYTTGKPDSKIKQLEVLGYRNRDIIVTFKTKKSQFDTITDELVKKGYLAPDVSDKMTSVYRINIPNIHFLTSFLQTLSAIEPSISTIASEIIESVKPYSKEEPTIPGWNKNGSFASTYASGGELNRSETYKNMSPDAKINQLHLLGYYNGNIRISLNIKKSEYDAVIDPLVANGFTKPDCINKSCGFHIIDIPNETVLNKFLTIISSVEPSINTIADNVKQSYSAAKINSRGFFDLRERNDEMDIDRGFRRLGAEAGKSFKTLMLGIQLLKSLTELDSKVSNNPSSFFAKGNKRQDSNNEKFLSDEQMTASAFGQASNTARRMGH